MKCPYCGKLNTRVVDSRPGKIELEVRRRRECQACSQRFTTYERVEQVPVMIVKKDNRREEYDRDKVLKGIKKACEKRAISMNLIEETVDGIERELRETNEREVSSKVVGEKIIQALKTVDDVAYVRFASVYREFKDVADFIQELRGLIPRECQPIEFDRITDTDKTQPAATGTGKTDSVKTGDQTRDDRS